MDRLPKRKELIFERARKTIYLRLTAVIRSLGTKFAESFDQGLIWSRIGLLGRESGSQQTSQSKSPHMLNCVAAEIMYVSSLYRWFIRAKNGDGRRTKKLREGITRLEWLRDNWDDLEIVGDLKNGYCLELKDVLQSDTQG